MLAGQAQVKSASAAKYTPTYRAYDLMHDAGGMVRLIQQGEIGDTSKQKSLSKARRCTEQGLLTLV